MTAYVLCNQINSEVKGAQKPASGVEVPAGNYRGSYGWQKPDAIGD